MSRETDLVNRIHHLREAEKTYLTHVDNPDVLQDIRRDIVRAEEELISIRERGPVPASEIRRQSANAIRNFVRKGSRVRNVLVEHQQLGPLGGVSSRITYEAQDRNGQWHRVMVNVYADGVYDFDPDEYI